MAENWKSHQINLWEELKISDFFEKIGVDYQKEFLDSIRQFPGEDPYVKHKWQWLANSVVKEGVLHLHPINAKNDELIWEEWFLYEGVLRHHVLSQKPLGMRDGTWSGDATDVDHPKEVLEIKWHYFNDKDLRPLGYRVN
jgi:hypothetical protein